MDNEQWLFAPDDTAFVHVDERNRDSTITKLSTLVDNLVPHRSASLIGSAFGKLPNNILRDLCVTFYGVLASDDLSTTQRKIRSRLGEARIRSAYESLRSIIRSSDIEYNNLNRSAFADGEFDALKDLLEALYAVDPTSVGDEYVEVGGNTSEGFAKVRHGIPMLSLGNAFDDIDVADFVGRARGFFQKDLLRDPAFKL
ncbi:MAG: hypothetical protein MO852_14705, partial [Candidatus Devosia euplotis]|nr:hypothetical protein [Candidatus Devosia euplotis]